MGPLWLAPRRTRSVRRLRHAAKLSASLGSLVGHKGESANLVDYHEHVESAGGARGIDVRGQFATGRKADRRQCVSKLAMRWQATSGAGRSAGFQTFEDGAEVRHRRACCALDAHARNQKRVK